jgi:hypothetical protein
MHQLHNKQDITLLTLHQSEQNLFFAFTGLVAASAAWGIFGSEIFPQQPDPTGGKFLYPPLFSR